MILYDQKSNVDWFYDGEMSADQMKELPDKKGLFKEPCVLYDDGAGKVYSWEPLSEAAKRYYVVCASDEETFEELEHRMFGNPYVSAQEEKIQRQLDALAGDAPQAEGEQEQLRISQMAQIRAAAQLSIRLQKSDLTDEQIISTSTLWPEWSADSAQYQTDDIVRYGTKLYRCEQAHTSQASWTPESAPSLWSQIDLAGDGVEVWTQPTGAHNAYNTGDRVHYPTKDDPIYMSKIDGNVWAPNAYPDGWELESE